MTTRILTILTVLLAAGSAGAQSDSLRCEARQMRVESQYYRCLSRCDRRVQRNEARPLERQRDLSQADCDATCENRFDDAIARVIGRPPCVDVPPPPPDPQVCEARTLRISASLLRCAARCGRQHRREGFDKAACVDTCLTRCGTAADQLSADPICAAGRIGSGDVCALH